ncbi:MAG: ABC transporter permease [Sandaracinaceae bacterium]
MSAAPSQTPPTPTRGGPSLRQRIDDWVSDPNPILVKELRAIFRTDLFVRFLYLSTGIVALIVLGIGAAVAAGNESPATVGQVVFHLFFGVTLFVITLIAPGAAAASITSEREQHTWESLVLSGMSAERIVAGKFVASYASTGLVVVAMSPIVGIAFLFGGISPVQVFVGLLSMLIALAPAIAFGVAISAHLSSTRLAIAAATIVYFPIAVIYTSTMSGFGSVAHRAWGLSFEGPFFYADAFATRAGEWDTWVLIGGGALYFFGMPVWFLLASAVAGVRPPAEDRSSALKVWAVAMSVTTVLTAAVICAVQPGLSDSASSGQFVIGATGILLAFYALVFSNEPPLPPGPYRLAMAKASSPRRAFAALGPGAGTTLRFTTLAIVLTSLAVAGATIGARHLLFPSGNHLRHDVAALVAAGGVAAVGVFAAALGSWFRLSLRHGLAARVLTTAILFAFAILPFMLVLVVDTYALDAMPRRIPGLLQPSIVYPFLLATHIVETGAVQDAWRVVIPIALYGLPALGLWLLIEGRVRRLTKQVDADREAHRASAEKRASIPPQAPRISRPSADPASQEATAEPEDSAAAPPEPKPEPPPPEADG